MKWKAMALLLVISIIVHSRLATYIAQEVFVVLIVLAAGLTVGLSIVIVCAFLFEGTRAAFRWIVAKCRGTGRLADRRPVHPIR